HVYNCSWGLWLHMTAENTLMPDYLFDELYPSSSLPLYKGWNFVSYPSVQPRTTADALGYISGGNWDRVEHYDAQSGWLIYDGPGGETDTLTNMEAGRGYWIHCTQDATWDLPYT
ncbi:MAG: hypothetical protein JSW28_09995, partial [Thermoplasmata archaeon]